MRSNKTEYDLKYQKENIGRVVVTGQNADIDRLKRGAAMEGLPVSTWLKRLAFARCDALEAMAGQQDTGEEEKHL